MRGLIIALILLPGAALFGSSIIHASGGNEKQYYVTAHIPRAMYEGSPTSIMVMTTDINGDPAPHKDVRIYLKSDNGTKAILHGRTDDSGLLSSTMTIPRQVSASASVRIWTEESAISSDVELVRAVNVLISTDKPLYQPGQTMNVRTYSVEGKESTPSTKMLTLEIRDADSNLIFRKALQPNEYGIASTSMPLSDQLNTGTYTIKATCEGKSFTKDVMVENYVLPKFKIEVNDIKDYYLIGEDVAGNISVHYFFGKQVEGRVEAEVLTYYDEWSVIDHLSGRLENGNLSFRLNGPDYAVGIPATQGNGLIELDVTVTDTAGHKEVDSTMIPVSKEPMVVSVVTDSNYVGAESRYYLIIKYASGHPAADADVVLGLGKAEKRSKTDERGIVAFDFLYSGEKEMMINVTKEGISTEKVLLLGNSPGVKVVPSGTGFFVGDTATFEVFYNGESMTQWVYYDVVCNGFSIRSGKLALEGGKGTFEVPVTSDMYPLSYVRVYKTQTNLNIARDVCVIGVDRPDEVTVDVTFGQNGKTYEPYSDVDLVFRVLKNGIGTVSALGAAVVDQSVYEMSERFTGLDKTVFGMEDEFSKPSVMVLGYVFSEYGSGGDVQDMPTVVNEDTELSETRFISSLYPGYQDDSKSSPNVWLLVFGTVGLVGGIVVVSMKVEKEKRKGIGIGIAMLGFGVMMLAAFSINSIIDSKGIDTDLDGVSDEYDDDDDNDGYYDWNELRNGSDPLNPNVIPTDVAADTEVQGKVAQEYDRWASDIDGDGRVDRDGDGTEEGFGSSEYDKDNDGSWEMDRWEFEAPMAPVEDAEDKAAGGFGLFGDFQKSEDNSDSQPMEKRTNEGVSSRDRPRQFFPETWYWDPCIITDQNGLAKVSLKTPDSLTTWKVDAVASMKDGSMGMGDGTLTVFKEFFVEPDIPVSVVRGDRFPMKAMVYNYGREDRNVTVSIDGDWYDLLDGDKEASLFVKAGEVASVEFNISARDVGEHKLTMEGDNGERIDTVKRTVKVVPDGKAVQATSNGKLQDNMTVTVPLSLDERRVPGSVNSWVKVQGGVESVLLDGAENYIQFVSGCGEQSMSTLSVDVLAYGLAQKNEGKPDELLKYEQVCTQGIQHELMYLVEGKSDPGRGIVWFPGDQDVHPWLTSWGLLTFQDAIDAGFTLDSKIISDMQLWLSKQQESDGSFRFPEWGLYETTNPILMSKKVSTTAYITRALLYSGYDPSSNVIGKAMRYISTGVKSSDNWNDAYTLSLALIALQKGGGDLSIRNEISERIIELAKTDAKGDVYWQSGSTMINGYDRGSNAVESTGYAIMALSGEYQIAQKGVSYLMDHRSDMGGFSSTQDTVVAFQAIKSYGVFPMDHMEIEVKMDEKTVKKIDLDDANKDLTNLIDLRPYLATTGTLTLISNGSGIVMYQVFLEQYLPWEVIGEERPDEFDFRVIYDTTEIRVDDTIKASVNLTYLGGAAQVRMVLIDLRAPVGFSFIKDEFASLDENGTIDFFEIKDRQCILYLEGLDKGVHVTFQYHLRADIVIESATIQDVAVWDMYDTELRSEESIVTVSSK